MWAQTCDALGSATLSTSVTAIPAVVLALLVGLVVFLQAHVAPLTALVVR